MPVVFQLVRDFVRKNRTQKLVGFVFFGSKFLSPNLNHFLKADIFTTNRTLLEQKSCDNRSQNESRQKNPENRHLIKIRLLNEEHRLVFFRHDTFSVDSGKNEFVFSRFQIRIRNNARAVRFAHVVFKTCQAVHEFDSLRCVKAQTGESDFNALCARIQNVFLAQIAVFNIVDCDAFDMDERFHRHLKDIHRVIHGESVNHRKPNPAVFVASSERSRCRSFRVESVILAVEFHIHLVFLFVCGINNLNRIHSRDSIIARQPEISSFVINQLKNRIGAKTVLARQILKLLRKTVNKTLGRTSRDSGSGADPQRAALVLNNFENDVSSKTIF